MDVNKRVPERRVASLKVAQVFSPFFAPSTCCNDDCEEERTQQKGRKKRKRNKKKAKGQHLILVNEPLAIPQDGLIRGIRGTRIP